MNRKLSRTSMVFGTAGFVAASVAMATLGAGAAHAATETWQSVLSVPTSTAGGFGTVVATGATSGWAFSNDSPNAYERTGATTWQSVPFPGTGGSVKVAAASSPSNVWAAYEVPGDGTQLYQWDGTQWTQVETLPGTVTQISVLGPDDVWVFGGVNGTAGIVHFDGTQWTQVSSTLQGGDAASDTDVWAFDGAAVEHYDGQNWTSTDVSGLLPVPAHGPASALTGIIELAPGNVYATAEGYTTPRGGPGVVLHFDGSTWSVAAESGAYASTGGTLAPDGQGGLWIEGQNFPARLPDLFHYSAGAISEVSTGAEIYSVSAIPGTSDALASGEVLGSNGTSNVYQYS
jgi:hypothetical protein